MNALIAKERYHFHERLFETNTLTLTKAGVASNADTSSRGSKAIAKRVAYNGVFAGYISKFTKFISGKMVNIAIRQ